MVEAGDKVAAGIEVARGVARAVGPALGPGIAFVLLGVWVSAGGGGCACLEEFGTMIDHKIGPNIASASNVPHPEVQPWLCTVTFTLFSSLIVSIPLYSCQPGAIPSPLCLSVFPITSITLRYPSGSVTRTNKASEVKAFCASSAGNTDLRL